MMRSWLELEAAPRAHLRSATPSRVRIRGGHEALAALVPIDQANDSRGVGNRWFGEAFRMIAWRGSFMARGLMKTAIMPRSTALHPENQRRQGVRLRYVLASRRCHRGRPEARARSSRRDADQITQGQNGTFKTRPCSRCPVSRRATREPASPRRVRRSDRGRITIAASSLRSGDPGTAADSRGGRDDRAGSRSRNGGAAMPLDRCGRRPRRSTRSGCFANSADQASRTKRTKLATRTASPCGATQELRAYRRKRKRSR